MVIMLQRELYEELEMILIWVVVTRKYTYAEKKNH